MGSTPDGPGPGAETGAGRTTDTDEGESPMRNGSMRVLVAATGVICALGMVAGCGGKDSADAAASTGNVVQSAED